MQNVGPHVCVYTAILLQHLTESLPCDWPRWDDSQLHELKSTSQQWKPTPNSQQLLPVAENLTHFVAYHQQMIITLMLPLWSRFWTDHILRRHNSWVRSLSRCKSYWSKLHSSIMCRALILYLQWSSPISWRELSMHIVIWSNRQYYVLARWLLY